MELNKIQSSGSWGKAADDLNQNFSKVNNAVEQVKNAATRNKGYFSSSDELIAAFPSANVGDVAYVGGAYPYQIWKWDATKGWYNTNQTGGEESVNLGDYYTKVKTDEKFTEADAKLSELGAEISVLDSDIFGTPILSSKGGYIPVNQGVGNVCPLSVVSYDGMDYIKKEVKKGEIYYVKGVGGNASRLWALVDKDTHVILDCAEATTESPQNAFNHTLKISSDCILVVNVYNGKANPPYGNFEGIPYSIRRTDKSLNAEVCKIYDCVFDNNISKLELSKGGYISVNQGVGNVCPMSVTLYDGMDYVQKDVKKGETYFIKGVGGNASRLWALVEKDTHVILDCAEANTASPQNAFNYTLEIPYDCILVVNVYNGGAEPPYGNFNTIPYSIDYVKNYSIVERLRHNISNLESVFGSPVLLSKGGYIPVNQGVGNVCPMSVTLYDGMDYVQKDVKKGETYFIKGVGGNASRLWALIDKDTHVILDCAEANTASPQNAFSYTLEIPYDCILVVNVYNKNATPPYGNFNSTPYSLIKNGNYEDEVFFVSKGIPQSASDYDKLWEKLVDNDIVTRETIASPNGLPMFCYRINKYNKIAYNPDNADFTVIKNNYFKKKKVLIISGVHGDEKQTPVWVYEFFNRLLNNKKYAQLCVTYEWCVIPIVNPTGYNASSRNNYNNVNINRDFARKTQIETNAVCNIIDNESFDTFIDCHQLTGGSGMSNTSPSVCTAFIGSNGMSEETLSDLCVRFSRGGVFADGILNKYFNRNVIQSAFVWPPINISEGDLQTHEYGIQKGIKKSYELEFTQYAYIFSGSDVKYNDGSMIYGNTMLHYLLSALLG